MVGRWFILLLGVALLQGAICGPIDETNEDWISYNEGSSSTVAPEVETCGENNDYRLPKTVKPTHYEVHLAPHFEEGERQFTFDGEVVIFITPIEPTTKITLHCNNLTIDGDTVKVEEVTNPSNDDTVKVEEVTNPSNPNPENLVDGDIANSYICHDKCSTFDIYTSALDLNKVYKVSMSFKGWLQTNMRGFYRSWYRDENNQIRWMATTQFQPGHARQAFPCFDEPGFKATFNISITRDIEGFNTTISNMPFLRNETDPDGKKVREYFYTTPPTSTYLLAFIVSGYKKVASNNDVIRPFDIYARPNVGGNGIYSLEVGVALLAEMEKYTGYPYYELKVDTGNNNEVVNYKMNMKQAAIPDFSAGAMENWGLLTYREALILYDKDNTNNFYKQRIANIISHEIAHMWFGNLVTCAWWNNLWLNEGFARFYQYFLTAIIEKDMGFETRFITEQLHTSMLSDATNTTTSHPLTNDVSDPSSVSRHFSTITYAKGASILRMTQHFLSEEVFQAGLKEYLVARAFDVAEPSDLFDALQEALNAATGPGVSTTAEPGGTTTADPSITTTVESGVPTIADPGITTTVESGVPTTAEPGVSTYNVTKYFESWTTHSGHPLLFVDVNHDNGTMRLSQKRFYRDEGTPETDEVWQIPITWTRGEAADFFNTTPSLLMVTPETSIERETTGWEWVIFNKQQTGFYRVNYDDITWALITRALRGEERTTIHEYNRAQIVDDVFLLARAKEIKYDEALNILSFLEFEDAYAPWISAIAGFNFALRRLAHDSLTLSKLRRQIIDLSTKVVSRLGFNETEKETNFMDDLFRMHLSTFLCDVGHPVCIDTAIRSFQQWRNGINIPPNMRPWVYCNGLRYGSASDYDFFWSKYLATDLANEQIVMITAAGCTSNQPRLNRFLTSIVNGTVENFVVRPQDYSAAVSSAITSNEVNTMRAFQWLQLSNNYNLSRDAGVVRSMITSITSRLLTERDIERVQNWVTQNEKTFEDVVDLFKDANDGLNASRRNLEFYKAREKEFNYYFDRGFSDEILNNPPTTTTPTTTTIDDDD